jgi:hypothetical protein
MRIVASAASDLAGVFARDNLWKRFRFGGVCFVASHAELRGVGKDGLLAGEVLCVASQRTMTGFASDIDMRAFAFCRDDLVVARGAGLAAGENGRLGGYFIQRPRAEVTVFAELGGDKGMPNREENHHQNSRDQRQPDQVLPALEDSAHALHKEHAARR